MQLIVVACWKLKIVLNNYCGAFVGTPAQTGNPLGSSQNDQMTQLMTQMMQAMTQVLQ